MKYGYARVSTDGQSVDAQLRQLTKAACKKVFREVASGAKTDRAQLRRLLGQLGAGDVLTVTRLDRLARSTRDLLNTLAAITAQESGFQIHWRHMGRHHDIARRLMLTALGVLAEFERDLIRARRRRLSAGRGAGAEIGPTVQAHRSPEARGDQAP
jgi:DNA invertase Pin-like site-specific DNA recombinase